MGKFQFFCESTFSTSNQILLTAEKSCKGNIHTQRKIFTNLDVLTPVKSKLTHGGLEFTVSDCAHPFYRNINPN